jgi:DNA/RNA endonuclease YhcR with UshA esterase domain
MIQRRNTHHLVVGLCLAASAAAYAGVPRLLSYQAKNHFRETATVCGLVVSAKYAASSPRSPTFLDLDHPNPRQPFTIVIWGDDRAKFGTPETTYASKRVCVTGTIEEYRGTPEIVVTSPSQISSDER